MQNKLLFGNMNLCNGCCISTKDRKTIEKCEACAGKEKVANKKASAKQGRNIRNEI